MNCTRCDGTGFLNIYQIPESMFSARGSAESSEKAADMVLKWISNNTEHDVQVCDCCGDGEDWHGEIGEHYSDHDPQGDGGPYEYNGGLCECH